MDIINHPLVYYHFQNETRVLARLSSPYIVRLIQNERTTAYIVLEFIPGMDLRKQMNARNIYSVSKALHYVYQVAQGLSYLHNCGVLHLDIKPENIMITPLDSIKIVDFGLARQLGAPDVLQEDFTIPHGTPYYAAPELLEHCRDDLRSDIYSLSIVLYEMLTGQLPFERTTDLSRVRRRLKNDPVPPRHYRKQIPEAIEEVILKALSRQPLGRYPEVEAFVQALEKAHMEGRTAVRTIGSQNSGDLLQCPVRQVHPLTNAKPHGILVALRDDDQAQVAVKAALKEVLSNGTTVTLLSVVANADPDEWTRYGDEVKGKKWGHRLEDFARQFRNYGIEPIVRIRSGDPSDVIVDTAATSRADLIIMGSSSKKFFKRLFGGRTIYRVLKKAPCRVVIAGKATSPRFPLEADPASLDMDDLIGIDYFLVTLWTQQLNWLATLVQGLLTEPLIAEKDFALEAPVAGWLASIKAHTQWIFLLQWVDDVHNRLMQMVKQMITAVKDDNQKHLRRLYLEEALPLLCHLRIGFQSISTTLREQATVGAYQRARLLEQSTCPLDNNTYRTGGPIRQLQAIREYFCTHPDASPDQCLHWLDSRNAQASSGGMDP